MKISFRTNRGIALLMVLIVLTVLMILAGGFSYSMKVETRLARNASYEADLEWLGRSGMELARYILVQQIPNEQWDSLNQKWAGGPAGTNEVLNRIEMTDHVLGSGKFSIKIIDLERKFNINLANEQIIQQALIIMGVDASLSPRIVDSILDWRDQDDERRNNGAESDYYKNIGGRKLGYEAKNGPIDDIHELLLIRDITPELFWGPGHSNVVSALRDTNPLDDTFIKPQGIGLIDLFNTSSMGRININTAPAHVLQLIPGVDENAATEIIRARSGPNGDEAGIDALPFRTPTEAFTGISGLSNVTIQQMAQYCFIRSATFEVQVDAEISGVKRTYFGVLRRNSTQDIVLLTFYWK